MFLSFDGVAATPNYNSPATFFTAQPAKMRESVFYFLEGDLFIPIFWEMISVSCPILKKRGSTQGQNGDFARFWC
jgi:hypothetical protein